MLERSLLREVKRIALLLGLDFGYCRGVLRGIQRYATTRHDWVFHDAPPDPSCLAALREWRPDGVIAHLFLPAVVSALRKLRRPIVNTTSALANCDFPLVEADHTKVGQMAAAYYLERGYTSFGYYGSRQTAFSYVRESSFRDEVDRAGFSVQSCFGDYLPRQLPSASWKRADRRVQLWLRKLKKPVAIFTSHDVAARDLADACIALELKVPQQVALLGVDNDEGVCRLARPMLSSIKLPAEQIGFQSARILDQMLRGEEPPTTPMFLPPTRVVVRRSTDLTAVDDATVRDALTYIQANCTSQIGVGDVSAGIGVGRRSLERRMTKYLGRTVLQELHRARIERAQELLDETNQTINAVALKVGFANARRFCDLFREHTGCAPSEYRRRGFQD